jgi:uncharacterized repeat protein (TIGR01451 family)
MSVRIAAESRGIAMSAKVLIVALLLLSAYATDAGARTCPAGLVPVAPDARYTIAEPVAGQRVVTDRETGLIWKQCPQGLSGASCAAGTLSTLSWSVALTAANAENFAGASDWRLPTALELRTLVETACYSPTINETAFPANGAGAYWTSTPQANTGIQLTWVQDFEQGSVGANTRDTLFGVRLVRGGRGIDNFDASGDYTPDAFNFIAQTGVPQSSLRTSNAITVANITTVTGIGISGAAGSQYRINGGSWTSAPGTVVDGDSIEVRHTSAATGTTVTTTTLGIGGISADFTSTTIPDTSDLALTLSDAPDPVVVGGLLSYGLTVTNSGPNAILAGQTLSISSALPAGLSGCVYTPSAGSFNVGTIAPGASGTGTWTGVGISGSGGTATLTIACTVSAAAAGSLSHTATVFPPTGIADPDCSGAPVNCAGNNTATAGTTVNRPQLTLTKTASGSSFTVGTPASFTLALANTGTAATTAASSITDTIPAGLTLGSLPGGCTAAGQTVTCTVAAGLAVSGNTSFVIPVTATVAAAPSVTNTATVSGGGDATCPADARCTSSVTVSTSGSCASISFPYTLAGADNTARVANLRTAIQCANLNGSADVIDLNGQSAILTDAFSSYSGATGLPQITSTIRLRNGAIVRNGAAPQFRILAMNATADLTLEGINMQGGRLGSLEDGGAILNNSGTLTLQSSFITNSQAGFSGAIYHENAALRIVDSVVSANITDSLGVITNAGGSVTIIDSTFAGNTQTTASSSAGVIYNASGTVTVAGSVFANNSTMGPAGAIQNFGGTVHIANSAFTGNSATSPTSFAGALLNNSGTMTIANSRITGNSAGNRAGALYSQGGSLTVSNSTIAGNNAPTDGGITIASGTATLVNSILWGNSSGGTLTGATVSYSIVQGGFAGTGILNVDPLFVAPVGFASAPTGSGDYRLQTYSPAADAGNNAAVPIDTLDVNGNANTSEEAPDLDGNPRRYNDTGIADTGAGAAPVVDLGAYERQTNSVVVAATVAPASLSVSEAGPTTDSFLLSLNAAPSSNVTVQLSFDGNVQVDTGSGFGASPQTVTLTPANAMSGVSVNVRAVDDAIDEADPHSITIVTSTTSSTNPGFNGLAVADVTVSISDNDSAGIVVTESAGSTSVSESGLADSYSVVLASQPTANVNVDIVFDPAQLVVGGQTDGTLSLQFTAVNWSSAQTVSVAAVNDTQVEANPHAATIVQTAASGDPLYAAINPADVAVSIADNDIQFIDFALASSSVSETNAAHTVTARLQVVANGIPGGTITTPMTAAVGMTLGTAEAGDINLSTTSVSFPPGSVHGATLPITLAPVNDRLLEGSETLTLGLTATSAIGSTLGSHVLTLTDDESGAISFASSSSSTSESAGTHSGAQPRLTISGSGTGPLAAEATVRVEITDTPGSATKPADYTRTTLTVSFPEGVASPINSGAAPVTIVNDVRIEGVEDFTLGFGAIDGAGVLTASGTHTVVINDNDSAQVGFAPGNDSVAESAGSFSKPVVLTLTADGTGTPSLQSALVVPVGFTEGAATEPEDFTLATASVSFAAGALNGTSQNATATLIDDAISEQTESFDLNLGNAFVTSNITLGRAATTVSITDNDAPGVTVTQSGGTTTVTEGGVTDSYTMVLTSQPTANVSITLNPGTQLSAAPTTLTFTSANWNQAQTVTVTAVDDAVVEGSHSGSISHAATSSDAVYNGISVGSVIATITDNDTAGVTVVESGGSTAVTEGGATDTYTVVLTSQPTGNVAIALAPSPQLSTTPSNLTFTAANWNQAQTVTVAAVDDALVEGAQSGAISQSASSSDPNYSSIAVASVNASISDNDSAVVNFAPVSVSQSEALSPMAFTVTLSNPVASGVTLMLNSADGTAGAADYTPITNATVSFAASSTTPQTINVAIINDALDEPNETFSLTLSNLVATGDVTLGAATATGTVIDDDPTPTLSITSPSQPEGNAGSSVMNFVVSLSAISGLPVTFTRATADGSATVVNNDYVAIPAEQLTIAAGQQTLTIPVTINGDTAFEGDESFSVVLTAINGATPTTITGTGTIVEDDQQPTTTTISSAAPDPSVVGQPYTVAVSVVGGSNSPLGTISVSDGSSSCGPVTLVAGNSPNSAASCVLTSTSAGSKTLTASYTPASSAFAASDDTEVHQVNIASTTISVSGPQRSRINQPTSFSFALSVNAPGAGTPGGTVTLSSGAASCTATLPATSCNLSFNALGSRIVSASYAGSASFGASSSSGAGNTQTLVYALADLSVTKSDGVSTFEPGDLLVYSVVVRNLGPDPAAGVRLTDLAPAGLTDIVWTCDASGGVTCPATNGGSSLDQTIGSFMSGGLLNFTYFGNVIGNPGSIVNTAQLSLPADTTVEDPDLGNNSASDTDVSGNMFSNGFEDALIQASAGTSGMSPNAGRALSDSAEAALTLDDDLGLAVRVYARSFDGQLQYALAVRTSNGKLRLQSWQQFSSQPSVYWTARATAQGWVLATAELR